MNKLDKEEHEQRITADIEDQRQLIQEQTKLKLEQQQMLERMEEEWLQIKAAFRSDTSTADNCKQISDTSQTKPAQCQTTKLYDKTLFW